MKKGFNLENTYSKLPDIFFTKQKPGKVERSEIILLNEDLIKELNLDREELIEKGDLYLSGRELIKGSEPLAQAYAGHQFGHFAMLGDGRGLLLGEHNINGESLDIALKGSGKTPYSRGGDGLASVGPMIREYIISEGMYALGIETTRSLAVVKTFEKVYRETILESAILTRVAKSHLRVGTFQYGRRFGNVHELKALADYAIDRHYKDIEDNEDKYIEFFKAVLDKQAKLIAKWQSVGFIHGVMNTDNMTISGETIDYGPCAFMDIYKRDTVFSSIDSYGRYKYENQPKIAPWNLARLAESLLPLFSDNDEVAVSIAENELIKFKDKFNKYYLDIMRNKLGLKKEETADIELIESLLNLMEEKKLDYTNTFYKLTVDENIEGLENFIKELRDRQKREEVSKEDIKTLMKRSNPVIIPRNHRVEEAIKKGIEGSYKETLDLVTALKNCYNYDLDLKYYMEGMKEDKPYVTYCGT